MNRSGHRLTLVLTLATLGCLFSPATKASPPPMTSLNQITPDPNGDWTLQYESSTINLTLPVFMRSRPGHLAAEPTQPIASFWKTLVTCGPERRRLDTEVTLLQCA